MPGMKRPLTPLEEAALRAKQSKPAAPGAALPPKPGAPAGAMAFGSPTGIKPVQSAAPAPAQQAQQAGATTTGGALGQKRAGDLEALAAARQAAIDRARAGAVKVHGPSDPRVGAVAPGAGNPAGKQGDGPAATPLDDLARLRADQAATRKATEEQLAANRAQALQDVAARSGLGGLGLSGASASLLADTGRVQDRNAVLARAELDSAQRDDEWQAVQRNAVLSDLEAADGVDYNGDGRIGGTTQQEQTRSNFDTLYRTEGRLRRDLDGDGVIGRPGTPENPRDPRGGIASEVSSPPPGASRVGTDEQFDYYNDAQGRYVKVRK